LIVGSSLHYIIFSLTSKKLVLCRSFLQCLWIYYLFFLHGCFLAVFRQFSVMICWCLVWNHSNLCTKLSTVLFSRWVMVKVWRLHKHSWKHGVQSMELPCEYLLCYLISKCLSCYLKSWRVYRLVASFKNMLNP
jgi:hypothetical protein